MPSWFIASLDDRPGKGWCQGAGTAATGAPTRRSAQLGCLWERSRSASTSSRLSALPLTGTASPWGACTTNCARTWGVDTVAPGAAVTGTPTSRRSQSSRCRSLFMTAKALRSATAPAVGAASLGVGDGSAAEVVVERCCEAVCVGGQDGQLDRSVFLLQIENQKRAALALELQDAP